MTAPEEAGERVAFTPDQQARVQELIDSAYKRAYSKAAGTGVRSDEVKRLESEIGKFKEYKKNSMIVSAISRHNVVDVSEVAELIAPRLAFDEGGRTRRTRQRNRPKCRYRRVRPPTGLVRDRIT